MKLKALLLGLVVVGSISANAQEDTARECMRMKVIAQNARLADVPDYKKSAAYLIKAYDICSSLEDNDYNLLMYSLQMAHGESDQAGQYLYADSILKFYKEMDKRNLYDPSNDLLRAFYTINCSAPDYAAADSFFVRGIQTAGDEVDPSYVHLYFFNLHTLHTMTEDKSQLDMRFIDEYFSMMDLANRKNWDSTYRQAVQGYFDAIYPDGDAVRRPAGDFIEHAVDMDVDALRKNGYKLLDVFDLKMGGEMPEYEQILEVLVNSGDESLDLMLKLVGVKIGKGNYSEAMSGYKKIVDLATDEDTKNEAKLGIAICHYKKGSWESAYRAGQDVEGSSKGEGLAIAGKAVAKNSNNCGLSSFEKKCNFIYAEELLTKAQSMGASVSGDIATCRDNFPSTEEWFRAGSPESVTIDCYHVTVKVKTKE